MELELYCRGGPSRRIDLVPNLSTEVVSTNGVDKVSTKLPLEEILPLMLETKQKKIDKTFELSNMKNKNHTHKSKNFRTDACIYACMHS